MGIMVYMRLDIEIKSTKEITMTTNRIQLIDPTTATGQAKELLDQVQGAFGMVPNLTKAFANSPVVLEGFLALSGALGKGTFSAAERELLAITTAQENGCEYCLSAHTKIGEMHGASSEDLAASRTGNASDAKIQAAQSLTVSVLKTKGNVSDSEIESARQGGLTDGQIMEVTALAVLNIYTNYLNHVAGTANDWPVVNISEPALA